MFRSPEDSLEFSLRYSLTKKTQAGLVEVALLQKCKHVAFPPARCYFVPCDHYKLPRTHRGAMFLASICLLIRAFMFTNAFKSCSEESLTSLDYATTTFQIKIKETLHILWEKPALNQQLLHVNLCLSF